MTQQRERSTSFRRGIRFSRKQGPARGPFCELLGAREAILEAAAQKVGLELLVNKRRQGHATCGHMPPTHSIPNR